MLSVHNRGLALLFFSLIFLTPACKSHKTASGSGTDGNAVQAEKTTGKEVIYMERTPCFGTCPSFSIHIFDNGKVTFKGGMYSEKQGSYEKYIPKKEVEEYIKTFLDNNFFGLKDVYTDNITDMPTTWIALTQKEKTKKIRDYYGAPNELHKLEDMIQQLADSKDGWKKVAEAEEEK